MPRTCTICTHPQRAAIDQALLNGEPFRYIAGRTGTSLAALVRHKTDHIAERLAKAHAVEEVRQADDLLSQLLALSKETVAILKEARADKTKDNRLALMAIARCEKQIELQAKLLGELTEGQTINILVLPEWQHIRTVLIASLSPYPEARIAVAAALQRVENANGYHA